MGQKIHPLGFRLGITQPYQSYWFASVNTDKYSEYVYQDFVLRQYLKVLLKTAGLAKVEIRRQIDQIEINLSVSRAASLFLEGDSKNLQTSNFEALRNNIEVFLKKKFSSLKLKKDFVRLVVHQVKNPELEASLTAASVAEQLEKRVAFRKAMRQAIQTAKIKNVPGIKIQISGRLNGAEMARTEWVRHGRVPLHTLNAKIDYCHCEAKTLYGILGVKVWIYQPS